VEFLEDARMVVTAWRCGYRRRPRSSAKLGRLWKIRSVRRFGVESDVAEGSDWVSPTEAAKLLRPTRGATAVRQMCDDGRLRTFYTDGGHRRIERASILELNAVYEMRPGSERDAQLAGLIRRNLGQEEPEPDQDVAE
jgi:hypothetical protein